MKAIGLIRVSVVGERDGETFHSPDDQRARIEALAAQRGWSLELYPPELDVSGAAPIDQRPQLSRAVTAVLTGRAQVIVGAYTDRLWRSAETRAHVLRLVESVGGEVWSADEGQISNGTAAGKFGGTVRTAADEFYRDQIAEKSRAAQVAAVERGTWMGPKVPPGYVKGANGVLEPGPNCDVVVQAFAMRAARKTLGDCRAFLRANGLDLSYGSASRMFRNRCYVGEVRFGDLVNPAAHPPLVDDETFRRASTVSDPVGRKAKCQRLLARQGILRCGDCGRPMSASTGHEGYWPLYRCAAHAGDGEPHSNTISAVHAERVIVEAAREALDGTVGVRAARDNIRAARNRLVEAQVELDAFIEVFSGVMAREAAQKRLEALQAAVQKAQAEVDQIEAPGDDVVVLLGREFDDLSLEDQRKAIKAVIKRAVVRRAPRGTDPASRIEVELWGFDIWSAPPLPTAL